MAQQLQRLAMKVKRMRTRRGLTQKALAKKAGISHGYLARLEIGRHDPSLSTLARLAKALGVPVGKLLG